MVCSKCKSEKIQVVSEYVELKEKENPKIVSLFTILGIVGLIFSLILIFATLSEKKSSEIITSIPMYVFGMDLLAFSVICLLLSGVIKALLPYKHTTQLRAVCLDCGHTWLIQTHSTAQGIEQQIIEKLNLLKFVDRAEFLQKLSLPVNSSNSNITNKLMVMDESKKIALLLEIETFSKEIG